MAGPISPKDIPSLKAKAIPEEVFEAFNKLIVKNMSNDKSIVKQSEVINLIIQTLLSRGFYKSVSENQLRGHIFNEHWLDIESIYRGFGWSVIYNKDDFGGPNSFFIFSKK